MKKRIFSIAGTALLAFLINSCTANGGSGGNGSPNGNTDGGGNYIQISGYAFNPSSLTVSNGTTVYWSNLDPMNHTVTSTGGQSYDSGPITPGAGFSVIFTNAGVNSYRCTIHTYMTATVTVTN